MLKVLMIFAVILVAANAPAQTEQKHSGGNGGGQTANADKRGTKDSPLVVDTHAIYSEKEAAEESAKVEEQKSTNRWNIGLAFVIAVCAFLQFCGIIAQVCVYLKQSSLMALALAANKKAADAAEMSANAAMGVTVPTLAITHFSISQRGSAGVAAGLQYPKVNIVVKNYGQSPAFIKSYSIMITCQHITEIPEIPDYDLTYCSGVVVDPQNTYHLPSDIPVFSSGEFTFKELDEMVAKTRYLRVFGIIWYGNIFDASIRPLKFCKQLLTYGPNEYTWNPQTVDEYGLPNYFGAPPTS